MTLLFYTVYLFCWFSAEAVLLALVLYMNKCSNRLRVERWVEQVLLEAIRKSWAVFRQDMKDLADYTIPAMLDKNNLYLIDYWVDFSNIPDANGKTQLEARFAVGWVGYKDLVKQFQGNLRWTESSPVSKEAPMDLSKVEEQFFTQKEFELKEWRTSFIIDQRHWKEISRLDFVYENIKYFGNKAFEGIKKGYDSQREFCPMIPLVLRKGEKPKVEWFVVCTQCEGGYEEYDQDFTPSRMICQTCRGTVYKYIENNEENQDQIAYWKNNL